MPLILRVAAVLTLPQPPVGVDLGCALTAKMDIIVVGRVEMRAATKAVSRVHKGAPSWWWRSLAAVLAMNVVVVLLGNGKLEGSGIYIFLVLTFAGLDVLLSLSFLLFSIVYFRYLKDGGPIDRQMK